MVGIDGVDARVGILLRCVRRGLYPPVCRFGCGGLSLGGPLV